MSDTAGLDSGGVVDALSHWIASRNSKGDPNASIPLLINLALVNKAYFEGLVRAGIRRVRETQHLCHMLIETEWIRRYQDVKRRSDTFLERVVTQSELRNCIESDLASLNALRSWMSKKLASTGVSRPFAVALTAYLRSLRPSTSVDKVLQPQFLHRLLLGCCTCGRLQCRAPSLRLRQSDDGSLVFICDSKKRR